MPLPKYKRATLKRPPLRIVIGQIRFPALFRFSDRTFLAPFQGALHEKYPRLVSENQVGVKFSPKGIEHSGESLWRFSDRSGEWSIVLGEGAVTLESRRYTSDVEFLVRFEELLKAAQQHLDLQEVTRIGFRYINEVREAGQTKLSDFGRLLNPKFVGFGGAPELLDGDVEQSIHDIRVRRADGMLVIRHGLLSGTTVTGRPGEAQPEGPFYLIDLDYFEERDRNFDIPKIIEQMEAYNATIYDFFRWSLEGGTQYAKMEPTE